MIPVILAQHIASGLADYVETTFPMTNKPFRGSIKRFAQQTGTLVQNPFVSIKLPFRTAGRHAKFPFTSLHPGFPPYAHQMRAFQRIANGKSTLVATGTGSGKTECFLYPILDYCYQQRRLGRKGIKAILVYPMNALAIDQAKRLAALIHDSPELNNNVTAGMYVGEQSLGGANKGNHVMTATSIVTDHDELLKTPPDILLTNYKMLDYLLVRPKDTRIWDDNDETTLKYFVVDEFHTFDGAQGTDLACLLRRLIDRLHTSSDKICCIGTSATMGTDETVESVCKYAQDIFNTTFTPESVITEDRLHASEFFDNEDADNTIPSAVQAEELINLEHDTDPKAYLSCVAQAWLEEWQQQQSIEGSAARIELGRQLKRSRFLCTLTDLISQHPRRVDGSLLDELAIRHLRFNSLNREQQKACVDALVSLVSYARAGNAQNPRPFLNVQVQLWVKELGRVVANVTGLDGEVDYRPAIELTQEDLRTRMPVINCRDCGGTAWIGLLGKDGWIGIRDMESFYSTFFDYKAKNDLITLQPCEMGFTPESDGCAAVWFCNSCMKAETVASFEPSECECSACGTPRIPMIARTMSLVEGRKHYRCPFCGSEQDIAMVGVRATTQISVMLTELSGDAFNDDDKAIVFSDSVQDASYRASVFNSRTWRFALRNSAVDYLEKNSMAGSSLADFLNHQNDYYHRRYDNEAEYIVRFIAPNMTWMREYDAVLRNNPAGPERKLLLDWIGRRIRLESLLELGMRCRIGRTLEKSGCAALAFDQPLMERVAVVTMERCHNEIGLRREAIDHDDWLHLTAAFLNLLRTRGAFLDVTYDRFLQQDGNTYFLSNKNEKWMPGVYVDEVPHFLSDKPSVRKKAFDTLDSGPYRQLVHRYLSEKSFESADIHRELLGILLEECVRAGIVGTIQVSSGPIPRTVYGLLETGCMVDDHVTQLVCDTCGRSYSCATRNLPAWRGARCRTRSCSGMLIAGTDETAALELGYYGKLYRNEPAIRIHAAEHTGLLSGDTRNRLEEQFKQEHPQPGAVNVLACTPTLEMGIDIGDLSTVILSSIPPSQAQYVQRAGRAGRRDGNSLILAVANSKEHDVYFYQRPEDMLAGSIDPPHIFLKATAVLERQLIAYALGKWVHEMLATGKVPQDIVPVKLKQCLDNIAEQQTNDFPLNFLEWTSKHTGELVTGFEELFGFGSETRNQLEAFARGTSGDSTMSRRIFDVFGRTSDTLTALSQQRREASRLLEELKDKPRDSSFMQQQLECEEEIRNLQQIINGIRNTSTFNYLSDQGVLPNYAFPETGVTLHTILKPDKEQPSGKNGVETLLENQRRSSRAITQDFVRPAASAITELAPGSTFFAAGRKYRISRILCAQGGTGDDIVMWRLCPNCSHAEPVSSSEHLASCPSCGSMQWADSGQKRPMVRINTVISEETESESQVDDTSDNRPKAHFVKNTLVDIAREHIDSAWEITGATSFGFDYTPKETIREINLGEAAGDGSQLEIAGTAANGKGFTVCARCGAVKEGNLVRHAYSCPERKRNAESLVIPGQKDTCLFLYREVKSEILRMLVPEIDGGTGSSGAAESLTAAVMLGMRRVFGNVDHIAVTLSNEPTSDGSGLRKTFLAFYDTVPGGTGYLKQMADPDVLRNVLAAAREAMQTCECAETDADGCYRCLYAYRQSRDLELISRHKALGMINKILDAHNTCRKIDTISTIDENPLFDSTLEQHFIEALRGLYAHPFAESTTVKGRRADLVQAFVNGKQGYQLTVNGCQWDVEPQVTLGPQSGVAQPCKPDFVLRLNNVDTDESDDRKSVAIFVDGIQYHAGIVKEDSLKREALRRAGYRVWSLTYDDVIGFVQGKTEKELADPLLDMNKMPSAEAYRKSIVQKRSDVFDPSIVGTMGLLGCYLARQDAEKIFTDQASSISFALNARDGNRNNPEIAAGLNSIESIQGEPRAEFTANSMHQYPHGKRLNAYVGLEMGGNTPPVTAHVGLLFNDVQRDDVNNQPGYNPLNTLDDDDRIDYKTQWSGYWHTVNLLQFSPDFHFMAETAMEGENPYVPLNVMSNQSEAVQEDSNGTGWSAIMADPTYLYLSEETKRFIEKAEKLSLPAPKELGYELTDEHGEVIGQADLAWVDVQVVFFPIIDIAADDTNVQAFTNCGWTVITDATADNDITECFNDGADGKES